MEPAAVFADHGDWVRGVARHAALRLPAAIDLDDLVGYGVVGLLEAAHRHRPENVPFRQFALPRVLGAMMDGVREWTMARHLQNVSAAAAECLLEHGRLYHGRPDRGRLDPGRRVLADRTPSRLALEVCDSVTSRLEDARRAAAVEHGLRRLRRWEAELLRRVYASGERLQDAGARLPHCGSRASAFRALQSVLEKLRQSANPA